jgi:hypothetical protein
LHVSFQLFFKEMCCILIKSLQVVHLIDTFLNTCSGRQGCIHFMHYSHYMPYSPFITYVNYVKCILCFADSFSKRTGVKKILMLKKNLVHLIDDIFWTMGFKPETETRAKKVVPITHTTPIIFKQINYITCPNYFIKLGLFYLYSFLLGSNFLSPGISLVIHYYNHYAD